MSPVKAWLIIVAAIILVAVGWLLIGALLAFLWNAILVEALALNIPMIDLWVGVGLAILITLIGRLFR